MRVRLIFWVVTACLFFLVLEGVSRLEWSSRSEVPFFSPNVAFYYPELRPGGEPLAPEKDSLDVLLLGGSVLHPDWGSIPQTLKEQLTQRTGRDVNVLNLAKPGHTTLDSLYKLRRLRGHALDLVVCYHGINDLRLNNCPRETFRQDYSHYSWYWVINRFENHRGIPDLACLFSLTYRFARLYEKLGASSRFIPKDRPIESMMQHGGDIKTEAPFRRNMAGILARARSEGTPVVLMPFAFHLPSDYSLEAFEARGLDYCLHSCAVEIWGRPEHIAKGIRAHNEILLSLAEGSDNVLLVDQRAGIPRSGRYFNDVCHLTQKGCGLFVENLVGALVPWMGWGCAETGEP